jgi:putative RecB family exonuclease
LQDYYRRYAPFTQGRTLGLEERIVIDLDLQGEYRLQGYIDRITQVGDGRYEIHDYKTSNSLPLQEHFDLDRQLALYQIGVERRFGDARQVDLVWHYLQFDRELRSKRDSSELNQLRYDTVGLIQSIQEEERKGVFPTHETSLCDWCEYMSLCPAKKHLFALQEASPEEFRHDDGVQLVDAWARVQETRREAQEKTAQELARLTDAIVRYASAHELEVIVGTGHKLRVKLRSGFKVPTRTDDPATLEGLIARLKGLGLYDRVSTLDRHAVLRLFEEDLEASQKRALEEYLVHDEGARITLSKLTDRERWVDL